MKKVALLSVISFAVTSLVITGFSQTAGAQVNGCYNSQDGTFRILISGQCKKSESPISLYTKGNIDEKVKALQDADAAESTARQSADTDLQNRVTALEALLTSYNEAGLKDLLCDYAISNGLPGCPSFCNCPPKVVFLSSQVYDGNLDGLGGADNKCQALANGAGLQGSFKAWLSDSTGASPASRFIRSGSGYALVGGTMVASSWEDLTDGFLSHPIDVYENGNQAQYPIDSIREVFTGTTTSGDYTRYFTSEGFCTDWTSSTWERYQSGMWVSSTGAWTALLRLGCGGPAHLYCFQQ